MKRRYQAALSHLPQLSFRPAAALRASLSEGYRKGDFLKDLQAGVVVGIVALPLAMALAIASGVPPQQGLYTSIIAGAVIAVLGGSRTQVSGPTAAFVVILAPIAGAHGIGGLLMATLMAGVILVVMGLARLGRLIQFIPHPVTTGFTAGIAVVIATSQIDKLLGLSGRFSDHWIERIAEVGGRLTDTNFTDLFIGALTLAVLILLPRRTKRVPAPLVALALGAVLGAVLVNVFGLHPTTLASKFAWTVGSQTGTGIPPFPPLPMFPWSFPDAAGKPLVLSVELMRTLLSSAFAIAILGAIESLLSAVVADGLAGTKHDPDSELVAQGVGNIVAPFFGGIAATGAIARTATNIRAGGRTPIAALIHSVFILVAVLLLAPVLGYLPMASMAALLLVVAWNMSEVKHFVHILNVAPKSDVAVLLTCFVLTVLTDMMIAVSVGVMLAALLFMRRMAEIAQVRLITESAEHPLPMQLPAGVLFYEIAGPLFFGAAQKALSALNSVDTPSKLVILDISQVPAMDVTGLVALESGLAPLRKRGARIIFAGVQEQPRGLLEKAGLTGKADDPDNQVFVCSTVADAVTLARQLTEAAPTRTRPTVPPVEAPAAGGPKPP